MNSIEKEIEKLRNGRKKQTSSKGLIVMTALLLLCFFGLGRGMAYFKARECAKDSEKELLQNEETGENDSNVLLDANGRQYTIVVDAGHGGKDPGKVGEGNVLEKNLNLSIAQKLKEALEQLGIHVIMTRTSDDALCKESDRNQKMTDLNNRIKLIEENSPNFVISIHQNSYTDSKVKGAQVFYLSDCSQGKTIAAYIQNSLNENIFFEKPREIKGNVSYYLLKKSPITTVIVECGFLSNPEECQKLTEDDYQNQIVAAIVNGILTYIQENTQ